MTPIISIIIPVYNVEKFIDRCMQSLLQQTFSDFEVIIVDDSSPDSSIAVAKNIVADDSRFHFYDKTNGGQAAARNFGFNFARGQYVVFIDSDDYYDKTFLEKMYNKIISEDADICICDINLVKEDGSLIRTHKSAYSSPISGETAFIDNIAMKSLLSLPGNKIIRRWVFEKNKFPEGMFYEDKAIALQQFYFAKKIVFINEPLYFYVQRANSTTNHFSSKKINDRFAAMEIIKNFLLSKKIYDQYESLFFICYLIYLPLSGGVQIAVYSNDKYKLLKELEQRLDKKIYKLSNILKLRKDYFKKMIGILLFKYCKPAFIYLSLREKSKNF